MTATMSLSIGPIVQRSKSALDEDEQQLLAEHRKATGHGKSLAERYGHLADKKAPQFKR